MNDIRLLFLLFGIVVSKSYRMVVIVLLGFMTQIKKNLAHFYFITGTVPGTVDVRTYLTYFHFYHMNEASVQYNFTEFYIGIVML